MKLSILMPTYNIESYIEECMGSILSQSYKNFELVIVDDGSTDKTVEIIKSFNDDRINLYECEHKGIVDALNFGWTKCSGEYIARMDGDDIMMNDRLIKQVNFMDKYKDVSLGYASSVPFKMHTKEYIENDIIYLDDSYIGMMKPICHPTVIFRKKDFDDINLRYDKEFEFEESQKIFDDAMRNGLKIAVDTKTLATYQRFHNTNTSKIHHERQQELLKKLFN